MSKFHSSQKIIREQGPLLALIFLIFGTFIVQVLIGPDWYRDLMTVPTSIVESWGQLAAGEITTSVLLTFGSLLTSALLHGNFEHVLFNLVFLWIFAALITQLLGHLWMLSIFVITAIAGSIGHTILNLESSIPMLGASGAVMGFMGAYLGLSVRWQLLDPHIWPMSRPVPPSNLAILAMIGIGLDLMGVVSQEQTGIAYGAHIGGFLAGLFLTSFVVRTVNVDAVHE